MSNTVNTPVEVVIPETIEKAHPEVAVAMREASDFFERELSRNSLEAGERRLSLYWGLEGNETAPTVWVEYHEALADHPEWPSRITSRKFPYDRLLDPVSREYTMLKLMFNVYDNRWKTMSEGSEVLLRQLDDEGSRGE